MMTGEEVTYVLATDGAVKGNPGVGGYAWILRTFQDGHQVNEFGAAGKVPLDPCGNNGAELYAVLAGLSQVPDGGRVRVVTDSLNVIGWVQSGWATNVPEIAALVRDIKGKIANNALVVTWTHVRGHTKDATADAELNRRVDAAARVAARS
jgi:ribonuclease HI